jgi:DNA primase
LRGHDDYAGRLCIPYVTPTGIVGMKFRALVDDVKPKYHGTSTPPRLYNSGVLIGDMGDTAVICEGELDAIVSQQVTGLPSVGIPGVDAWKPSWRRCFAGMTVYMVPDADQPNRRTGERPGEKLLKKVRETIPHLIVIRLPEGHDVTSYVVDEGPDAYREKFPNV